MLMNEMAKNKMKFEPTEEDRPTQPKEVKETR